MANPLVEAEYPIAAVSKLTGVSCHALRVWERRYGFPLPHRSASGHRRYALDQVLILRRLSELSRDGRAISELIEDFRAGRIPIEAGAAAAVSDTAGLQRQVDELLELLLTGDLAAAGSCFDRLGEGLGVEELVSWVIAPALTETGERWFRKSCAVFQERCVSGFLRRRLDLMIESARAENVRPRVKVLLGSVQGDRHEGGVQIANLHLERAGWRVINLGVDLPVSEYVRAVDFLKPDALALSFVLSRNINKRFQELTKLDGFPIFVGGRSILNYQGLARRYGLIPVPGPAPAAVRQMIDEFEAYAGRQTGAPSVQ